MLIAIDLLHYRLVFTVFKPAAVGEISPTSNEISYTGVEPDFLVKLSFGYNWIVNGNFAMG